jgi:PKD repeat protein
MTFPVNGILDDFQRANEGPPPSASWIAMPTFNGLVVSSNQCVLFNVTDQGAAIYNTDFGPNCEVYLTVTGADAIGANNLVLYLRCQSNDILDCYYLAVRFQPVAGDMGLSSSVAGFNTLLGTATLIDWSIGDAIGLSAVGTSIKAYRKPFGGSWTELISVTDSAVSAAGKLAVLFYPDSGSGVAIDDFGGGTIAGPVAPVADFSGTPVSGAAPLTVAFTDLSTGTPVTWAWDFGDGGTSSDQNPTYAYTAPGTYTVALTATNGVGDDTETKVDYITVLGPPVADFSGDTLTGPVPLTVNFTDASTNTPTSWFWDFGDGGSSAVQNPTYIYAYTGVYTVTLTATNSAGSDSETKIAYITVTAVAEYGASVVENCDIDTGGAAVGLRVSDVAYARDNRLGSVVIDASAELRVKDNSYSTLTLNGTLTSLAGDRSVWDTANFPDAHASDINDTTFIYHRNPALAASYTVTNPVTLRTIDLSSFTLNELGAIVGTLLADLGMA